MKNKKIFLVILALFVMNSTVYSQTLYRKHIVIDKKTGKTKIVRKKVRLVKVSKKEKKEEEKKPEITEKRYIKNAIASVRRTRTVILETNDLPGTSIGLGGKVVPADGRTYAYNKTEQELSLSLGYGVEKSDGVFYDGNLVILPDEKEIDFGLGLPINSMEFSLLENKILPYLKLIGGFSYGSLELKMPDSFFYGNGLGFQKLSSDNFSFSGELFSKTKFFRGISSSYGTEQTTEEQFGVAVSIKYFLD